MPNQHEVKLLLSTETTGEGNIRILSADLQKVAEVSDEAAEAAAPLAREFDALGKKQALNNQLQALQKALGRTADQLGEQTKRLRELKAQYDAAEKPSQRLTASYQKQAARVRDLLERKKQLGGQLSNLSGRLKAYNLSTTNAVKNQVQLSRSTGEAKLKLQDLQRQYGKTGEAADLAGAKQRKSLDALKPRIDGLSGSIKAFIGAYAGLQGVRALSQQADEWSQLNSALRQVTQTEEELVSVRERLFEVSQDTRTDLTATVDLYAKVARNTKELGLSQQEVIDITRTVSQSFQISGASATEAAGGTRQFAQALASGVLRGDEFNSVMENAPRLAEALAASLGVSTGELRAMAEQGELTADKLVNALSGQATDIAAEYEKVTPTIASAITTVENAWLQYIGTADDAGSVSAEVSDALMSLAENMDTIGAVISTAANSIDIALTSIVMRAFQAIEAWNRLMATITTGDTAAQFEAQAIAAASTVEQLKLEIEQDTADIKAAWDRSGNAAAQAGQKTAEGAAVATDAGDKLATATGKVVEAVGKQIEAGAKATDAALKQLDKIGTKSGDQVVAIAKGLQAATEAGTIGASDVQAAWSEALAEMSGEELTRFSDTIHKEFSGSEESVRGLGTVIDAVNQESLKRLGVDSQEILTGLSSEFRNTAQTVDQLAASGRVTGDVMEAALSRLADTANSQQAVEAVRQRVEALRESGALSEGAFERLGQKLDVLGSKAAGVADPFRELGIVSQQAANQIAGNLMGAYAEAREAGFRSARDQEVAFKRMAAAVIESGDHAKITMLDAEAATLGLTKWLYEAKDAAAEAGRSMEDAGYRGAKSFRDAAKSAREYRQEAEAASSVPPPGDQDSGSDYQAPLTGIGVPSGVVDQFNRLADQLGDDFVREYERLAKETGALSGKFANEIQLDNQARGLIERAAFNLQANAKPDPSTTPARTVRHEFQIGGKSFAVDATEGSSDDLDRLMSELERLSMAGG